MAKKKATAPSATADHVDGAPTMADVDEVANATMAPPEHELSSEPGPPPPSIDEVNFESWKGAVMIPLDRLVFTNWNVNEMNDAEFSELVAEIEAGATPENKMAGFDEPCDVVPSPDDPKVFLVLGGEHRTRAANALQWKEIPCVVKTHLIGKPEAELMEWSVRRNNIRGRINEQKYRQLEHVLSTKHKVQLEAARGRMLIKGELLKSLAANKEKEKENGSSGAGDGGGGGDTDGDRDKKKETRDRKKLLEALKSAETDVLLQSADTVEHGYLYFGQGGHKHLVVDEPAKLHALVAEMVAACKGDSAKVSDFLTAAIEKELPAWK